VEPEEVARGIVRCAESPKREVTYSRTGRLAEIAHVVAPGLYERLLPPAFEAGNYADAPAPKGPGAVAESHADGSVRGGWKGGQRGELRGAMLAAIAGAGRALRPRR
jgi:hypothetical protein